MPAVAHKTLLTELQMTISNTLTEIPFLDNIELDPGENKIHNLMGVNRSYENLLKMISNPSIMHIPR